MYRYAMYDGWMTLQSTLDMWTTTAQGDVPRKLSIVNVKCKDVSESEIMHLGLPMCNVSVYVDVQCEWLCQGSMQSRWESLFSIMFSSLSCEDATMACKRTIQWCHLDWKFFPRWRWLHIALHLYLVLVINENLHSSSFIWYLEKFHMPDSTSNFSGVIYFFPSCEKCSIESQGVRTLRKTLSLLLLLHRHLKKKIVTWICLKRILPKNLRMHNL